jgi:hypothetical protein
MRADACLQDHYFYVGFHIIGANAASYVVVDGSSLSDRPPRRVRSSRFPDMVIRYSNEWRRVLAESCATTLTDFEWLPRGYGAA